MNKKNIKILLFLCLIQLLIIPILVFIIKISIGVGDFIPESLLLLRIDTKGYELTLNDYLILITYFIQIIVTSIFSYFLWKTSNKSNIIAEELKENTLNGQKSVVKENALIVYFDLLRGLNDLKKLYERRIKLRGKVIAPKRLFFSEEWIKNVAIMKEYLNNNDINEIYQLYGDMFSIKELLESKENSELNEEIKKVSEKVFDKIYIKYNNSSLEVEDVESVLNLRYQAIFEKLRKIIYISTNINYRVKLNDNKIKVKSNDNKIWCFYDKESEILNGYMEIYNDNNKIRYRGEFINGILNNGTRYEYKANGLLYMEMKYKDSQYDEGKVYSEDSKYVDGIFKNGEIYTGYSSQVKVSNNVYYNGQLKEGKRHGIGELDGYNNGEEFIYQGEFNNNEFIKGIKKDVFLKDNNGRYYCTEDIKRQLVEIIGQDKFTEDNLGVYELLPCKIVADINYDNGIERINESSIRINGQPFVRTNP